MTLSSVGNFYYKLKALLWAKNLHLHVPIFLGQSGRLQLWHLVLKKNNIDQTDFETFLIPLNSHNQSIKLKSTLSLTSVDFFR